MKREIYSIFGCHEYVELKKEDCLFLETRIVIGRGYRDIYSTIYLNPRVNINDIDRDRIPIFYVSYDEVKEEILSIFIAILQKFYIDIEMDRLGNFFVIDKNDMVLETVLWIARLKGQNGDWIGKRPFLIIAQPYVPDDTLLFSESGYSISFLGNVL